LSGKGGGIKIIPPPNKLYKDPVSGKGGGTKIIPPPPNKLYKDPVGPISQPKYNRTDLQGTDVYQLPNAIPRWNFHRKVSLGPGPMKQATWYFKKNFI
jgi:hypothetical protein